MGRFDFWRGAGAWVQITPLQVEGFSLLLFRDTATSRIVRVDRASS